MICTFECIFCAGCIESVLHGVCRNLRGWLFSASGKTEEKLERGNFLVKYLSSQEIKHRPVDIANHKESSFKIGLLAPE